MATKQADIITTPTHVEASQTLDDGDHMDLNPGELGIDTVEIHSIIHENDCDVKRRIDSTDNGTFDREVTIDSFTGAGISQGNELEIGSNGNSVLRITDTSSGTDNDYILTGEVLG